MNSSPRPRGVGRRLGHAMVAGRDERGLGVKLTVLVVLAALFLAALLIGVARGLA